MDVSEVRRSQELTRILALPRRAVQADDLVSLVKGLTDVLRTDGGRQQIRPVQALALHDIGTVGGGFLPVGVGEGKTLISLLAAYVLDAKRPLLLLPASLIEKTKRDRAAYAKHWLVPNHIRLFSYDMLGRTQSAAELETYKPDLIISDEVHRLKNRRAACTRRVSRWMHDHPETMFIGMSGTIMRKSLKDFAHILRWALKDGAPIPKTEQEIEEWASALDEPNPGVPGAELTQLDPGALLELCTPEQRALDPVQAARKGFRSRLVETPGVVATAGEGERVDCSLYIRAHVLKVQPITEQHFATLRGMWQRPDGKEFEQGVEVWACARQLALGLHYEWSPPPPEPWMTARKAWSKYVRNVLAYSRTLDSPLEVINAIDAGRIHDEGNVLAKWRAVRDTFQPITVPVWHDTSALEFCADWAKRSGIVWTEHHHFATRLAKETGLPYFGESGFSRDGTYIEDAPAGPIIASIRANKDGKNLQHRWSRNLIVSPPEGWDVWQQAIARTHRPGQTADEVEVDVIWSCREHIAAWHKAWAGTLAARDTVGSDDVLPKLLLADVSLPDTSKLSGYRWRNM